LKKTAYILALALLSFALSAQKRTVQNQPYADFKLYHFGFHVGLHTQDLILTNNGLPTEDGVTRWFAEIPSYSPGFSVGVIGDLFLNPYMNLRLTPTIHFGDKVVHFISTGSLQDEKRISIRSNYIDMPLSVKIQSMRLNNYRPYITGGVYGALELGRKTGTLLLFNTMDYGLEFGVGCTVYMPFFRLAPEIKFKFGMADLLEKKRDDLTNDADRVFTNALSKATSRMIVFTFNFE